MLNACVLLAVIATSSTEPGPVLRFRNPGSAECTISNVGGTLQAGCGSDSPQNIISSVTPADLSLITDRLNFMEDNIDRLWDHTPCRPGQFRPTGNPFADAHDDRHQVCATCPGDSYTTEFSFASTCIPCPSGYGHDNTHDHTYCDVCAPGYGFNNGQLDSSHTFCDACGVNEYQNGADRDSCSTCPTLTHTGGQGAQAACAMCIAGYERTGFNSDGHAICSACTLGQTYTTDSMQTCDTLSGCPVGKGAKVATESYSTSFDSPIDYCESCSDDTVYSDANTLSACLTHDPCAAGMGVSNYGSVSDIQHRSCVDCGTNGYSASDVFHRCWSVSAAHSKTSDPTKPLQCASDYYSSGQISYVSSTGAKSTGTKCHQCVTCSTQVKTACNTADGRGLTDVAGSNTACCDSMDKPAYATLTSSGAYNLIGNSCKYNCNAFATGKECTTCISGYSWQGNACALDLPVVATVAHPNVYCGGGAFDKVWKKNYASDFNYDQAAVIAACRTDTKELGFVNFITNRHTWSNNRYCYTCSNINTKASNSDYDIYDVN